MIRRAPQIPVAESPQLQPGMEARLELRQTRQNCGGVRGSCPIDPRSCCEKIRHQQSSSVSYFDVLWVSAAAAVVLAFLVMLMRPSPRRAQLAAE